MIPFPGESLAVFQAWTAGDYTLANDITAREGSRTLAAGAQWRAWAYDGETNYLEDGAEDVAVSWVVEVLSGTVTLTAAEGLDPTYGDPAAASPVALGSHTVTGPATLVIPSAFTGAQVVDGPGSFMLVIDATSGAAVVQQVKLRVWPTGGAVGGWSEVRPGFNDVEVSPDSRLANTPIMSGRATSTDPEAAWDDAYAEFLTSVAAASVSQPRDLLTSAPAGPFVAQAMHRVDLGTLEGVHDLLASVVVLFGQDWRKAFPIAADLVEGVDWIIPPNEIPGDFNVYAQATEDGGTGWTNAFVTTADEAGTTMPGGAVVASTAGEFDPDTDGRLTLPIDHAGSSGVVALDTSGRDIVITASHSIVGGMGSDWPGWIPSLIESITRSNGFGYTYHLGPIMSYAILPPYRTWSPTVTPIEPLRLIQRGDGLGMGSGRLLGSGTRQNSPRVFGAP